MKIYGFQKSTLLDYPEHLAATIFTGTCNFLCPFCHNGGLVLHTEMLSTIPEAEIFAYLKKRRNILEGVCITGGEPTIQPDLLPFIQQIKKLGYQIKLDTNGYRPDILQLLLDHNLLNYIAMDLKNCPQNYAKTCGLSTINLDNINSSITMIKQSGIPYEFRTTVVKELHTLEDLLNIATWIKSDTDTLYYLQNYRSSPDLIYKGYHAYDKNTLESFLLELRKVLPKAQLRGVD